MYISNDNNIGLQRQYEREYDTMIIENEELKNIVKGLSKD